MRDITDLVMEFSRESGLLTTLDAVRYTPAKRGRGRPIYYSNNSMLRAVALRFLQNERYANDFVAFLERSVPAQRLCGFKDGYTPCEATFSRFNRLLSEHIGALWDAFAAAAPRINAHIADGREKGSFGDDAPPFGHILAIDSTDVASFSDWNRRLHIDPSCPKPDKPRECRSTLPNCCKPRDWKGDDGVRTDKDAPGGMTGFYGYKLHTICDAYYGTPLHALLLPANASDTRQLRLLVEEMLKRYPWLAPMYLLADKGYDSEANFVFLDSIGIIPVIAVRKPRRKKGRRRATYDVLSSDGTYEGTFDKNGFPLCAGDIPMDYVGSDAERGHLFRCSQEGCDMKKKTLIPWLYCSDQQWEKSEGKLLRIVGKLPRFTKKWKEIYKLRQAIERFFGSGKQSRLLDTQRYLTMAKVETHTASLLTYTSTMLMRLMVGDFARMRHMRVKGK